MMEELCKDGKSNEVLLEFLKLKVEVLGKFCDEKLLSVSLE